MKTLKNSRPMCSSNKSHLRSTSTEMSTGVISIRPLRRAAHRRSRRRRRTPRRTRTLRQTTHCPPLITHKPTNHLLQPLKPHLHLLLGTPGSNPSATRRPPILRRPNSPRRSKDCAGGQIPFTRSRIPAPLAASADWMLAVTFQFPGPAGDARYRTPGPFVYPGSADRCCYVGAEDVGEGG